MKTRIKGAANCRIRKSSVLCAVVVAAAQAGWAQGQDSTPRVEKIEVTGSNIKRVEGETASPIQIINRKDIERSGAVTMNEALQKLTSSGYASDERITNTFTPGAAALNLRALGFNSTLVLVNGRRLPTFPFAQQFGTPQGFQDLNSIPLGAVERVEILKDGASAVYGADAVAGVVNIILRRDFQGGEAVVRLGQTSRNDGEQMGAALTFGKGNPSVDGYNALITLEIQKQEEVLSGSRGFTSTEDLRARGGSDFRSSFASPGTYIDFLGSGVLPGGAQTLPAANCTTARAGFCRLDRVREGSSLSPESERVSALGRFSIDANANTQLFAEFGLSKNEQQTHTLAPAGDYDPVLGRVNFVVLPVGHNSNPYSTPIGFRYRFNDVGVRVSDTEVETLRILAGGKGKVGMFDWEAALTYGKVDITNLTTNHMTVAQLAANLSAYNFLNPSANSPSLLSRMRFSDPRIGESEVKGLDAKLSGDLMQLPGGALAFAAGIEVREEELSDTASPESISGQLVGSGGTSAFGSRKVGAAFVEFSAPIRKDLEVVAAIRNDRYSGNYKASASSPKIGVRYQPTSNLLFRASHGKSFRAPSLFETTPAGTLGFFFGLVDPVRCIAGTEPDCSLDINATTVGNPALKPERSKISNFGVVVEPIKNLSIGIDFFKIDRTDEIGAFAPQQLLTLFARDPSIVVRASTGEVIGLNIVPVNLNKTKAEGFDLDVRFTRQTGLGTFEFTTAASYFSKYDFTTVTAQADGTAAQSTSTFISTYNLPRWRRTHSIGWSKGDWELNLRGDYMAESDTLVQTPSIARISRDEVYTLTAAYTGFKNLRIVGTINNVMDKDPPFSNESQGTTAGYNPSLHSPLGRNFQLAFTYKFR